MSRINTNVSSIIAQRILTQQNNRLNLSLQRLSTGLRINTGRDDPAGLIASEAMRAEMRAVQAAQTNIARAANVVSVAESGLAEVNRLLTDLEELVDRTANETGISAEEKAANQQEIDLILASINRIANSTELQGRKLLAGDLAYSTSAVAGADIAALQLHSVRVPNGGFTTVSIDVITSASYADITYTGGALGSAQTIEVTGSLGSERITLGSGATTYNIASAVNMVKHLTGVSAAALTATSAQFYSAEYGSSEFVRIRVLTGSQIAADLGGTDVLAEGQDVVVNVAGQQFTGDGRRLSIRTNVLDADILLAAAFATDESQSTEFYVKGGGANFAITPKLDSNGQATLGIAAVTTASLGETNYELYLLGSGEAYSMNAGDFFTAQRIVRTAITQVGTLRGRLGSFHKNTLETTSNALKIQYENVAAAESVLRDTDFAEETSNLTRSQILVQSATNVLRLANAAPQNVLALIG